jgi:hypothetical protein
VIRSQINKIVSWGLLSHKLCATKRNGLTSIWSTTIS